MNKSALIIDQKNNQYKIINDKCQIIIEHENDFPVLHSLAFVNGREFLSNSTKLFDIVMIDKNNQRQRLNNANQVTPHIQNQNQKVEITWAGLVIGNTNQKADVKIELLFEENGTINWYIHILNIPADWSVFQVYFPALDLKAEESEKYALVLPFDRGVRLPNPLKTLPQSRIIGLERIRTRHYPHGGFTMQFLALEAEKDLLYFAAHDKDASLKVFYFDADPQNKRIRIQPHVPTELNFGGNYSSFPWTTVLTQGDWYNAACLYRKFALNANWTKAGSLEEGKTPSWYKKTPIVSLRPHRGPGYENEDLIDEKNFFEVPMVTHYYMWHRSPFDAGNPYFFPTVPGFRKVIRQLQQHNINVMPYINPYSADTSLAEWQGSLANLALKKNPEGDLSLTTWSQGHTFAGMCPAAPLWRRITNQLALRMYEMGIKTLYFDEICASPAQPCYDKSHGHISGGGTTYVENYCSYLKEIRQEASDFVEDLVMTAEGCAEPYMQYIDAFLIGNANDPYTVPLFEAVYHDYVMGFGRYTFTPELVNDKFKGAIISKHAQQFVWGTQFGWSRIPLKAIIQKDLKTAKFLKHLAHVWINNTEYLACGKMLRPLDFSDQVKPITVRWAMAWNDETGTEVQLSPVLNSVWQINDGSIAVCLVNITDNDISLKVKLPSVQRLLAQRANNEKVQEANDLLLSSKAYPLPQNTIGIMRKMEDKKVIDTIADGDTEGGFNAKIEGLSCVLLLIGSEKKYGTHNF